MMKKLNSKYINLDYLYELSSGDEDFIREMIESFINQTPQTLQDMAALKTRRQWEELSRLAHKTRSSLNFMGVQQMAEDVGKLESLCNSHQQAAFSEKKVEEILKNINHIFELTRKDLKEKLANW